MWSCPLCSKNLIKVKNTWTCENRHSFDEAKSGYVNLLPVQHKHSLEPGDNKQMVKARRDFHASAGYMPLMVKLSEMVAECLQSHVLSKPSLFEAGCGEGSYLATISELLAEQGVDVRSAGIDISKAAIELASKAFKQCKFVVGSNFKLPLSDSSQHVILQIFAPGNMNEYARVLTTNGVVITVEPGKRHLWELKQAIYDTPKQHEQQNQCFHDFELASTEQLSFSVDLSDDVRQQGLLNMTPFVWKLNNQKRTKINTALQSVSAEFTIRKWKLLTDNLKGFDHSQ